MFLYVLFNLLVLKQLGVIILVTSRQAALQFEYHNSRQTLSTECFRCEHALRPKYQEKLRNNI